MATTAAERSAMTRALELAQTHTFTRPVVAEESMTVSYDTVQPDWLFLLDADMVLKVEEACGALDIRQGFRAGHFLPLENLA